jgi:integral membrane protein
MKELFSSSLGLLRIVGFLEGVSSIALFFIAVPMKYYWGNPIGTKIVGSIHGGLFLLFVVTTLYVTVVRNWKFKEITWKLLVASIIPFGTFYVDAKILNKEKDAPS